MSVQVKMLPSWRLPNFDLDIELRMDSTGDLDLYQGGDYEMIIATNEEDLDSLIEILIDAKKYIKALKESK